MLSVSRLLNGQVSPADVLRYGHQGTRPDLLHFAIEKKPVVVWNMTAACNLHCLHCYASATNRPLPNELTTSEGVALLGQLADFGVPSVLFSGGEPLTRPDVFELARAATALGLRVVLSTNGTRIDARAARQIAESGFSYVGVSLDGLEGTHDRIRGQAGAFAASVQALRHLRERGVRTGLRFTMHSANISELPAFFDLLESEQIDRLCVYHLAYSGRGRRISNLDLSPEETRDALDFIFDRAEDFHRRGLAKEVLTVDNHADNPYLYMRLRDRGDPAADNVLKLLTWNGGNQSGIAVASVHPTGTVHADQFSWHYSFGNVRERDFGSIWSDLADERMRTLKDRKPSLPQRCRECPWLSICNGNLRSRAEHATGDFLGFDPACYLTPAETSYGIDKRTLPV